MDKKITIERIEMNEIPFFISYSLYLSLTILCSSFYARYIPGMIYDLTFIFCIWILCITELRYSIIIMSGKKALSLAVCLFLFCIIYRISGRSESILIMYIFCARNIKFEKIAEITLLISSFLLFFVVISGYLGIIPNYQSTGERHRQYLGFLYALYPSTYMLNITMLYSYIKKEKIRIFQCVCLMGINYWFFLKTNSRLTFVLSVSVIIAGLVYKYMPDMLGRVMETKIISAVTIGIFIFAAAISFCLTITYTHSILWMHKLNVFMESRLSLGQSSLLKHGVSLFGKHINWVGGGLDIYGNRPGGKYSWVDCLYIQVTQRYGVVFMLIFLIAATFALYKLYKRKEYYLMMLLAVVAFHCIIDDLSWHLYYNTFWIPIGNVLMSSRSDSEITGKSINA